MQAEEFIKSGQKVAFSSNPTKSVLCIVDSSFNPPNRAHVQLARLCNEHYNDATIVLMLGTGNADKPAAPPNQLQKRLNMMELVTKSKELSAANCVLAMTTESRFIDKALALHAAKTTTEPIVFAMGYDTLVRFGDPKYYTDEPAESVFVRFFGVAEIFVLTRVDDVVSGTPALGSLEAQKAQVEKMFGKYANRVHVAVSTKDTEEVSSSRARLAAAELRRQVTPEVAEYLIVNELY